ncbi:MAG: transposase [Phycisphaerae bacterium]|jgi:REP element-mobilizing transposase RayT|nr:transposase [Phycisphaerae bacterium]
MARPLRVEYEGAIYHVTVRGNDRRNIFLDDRGRRRFLDRLADCVEAHEVRLYMFCLMGNHFHLMLETPAGNLSEFMHRLQTAYSVYFNRRHQRSGHLFQGRFGARVVRGEGYILRLSRYIHLNPIVTSSAKKLPLRERIDMLRRYRWSSYRSYIGRAARLEFVDYAPMLAMTKAATKAKRPAEYRKFVEAGIAESDRDFERIVKSSPLAIGSEQFMLWVRGMHDKLSGTRRRAEDVTLRRRSRRLSPERVIEIVCGRLGADREDVGRRQRDSLLRPIVAKMLCRYSGLTQRQAGEFLNLSTGAAVSIQLKTLAAAAASKGKLRKQLVAIDKAIKAEIEGSSDP